MLKNKRKKKTALDSSFGLSFNTLDSWNSDQSLPPINYDGTEDLGEIASNTGTPVKSVEAELETEIPQEDTNNEEANKTAGTRKRKTAGSTTSQTPKKRRKQSNKLNLLLESSRKLLKGLKPKRRTRFQNNTL